MRGGGRRGKSTPLRVMGKRTALKVDQVRLGNGYRVGEYPRARRLPPKRRPRRNVGISFRKARLTGTTRIPSSTTAIYRAHGPGNHPRDARRDGGPVRVHADVRGILEEEGTTTATRPSAQSMWEQLPALRFRGEAGGALSVRAVTRATCSSEGTFLATCSSEGTFASRDGPPVSNETVVAASASIWDVSIRHSDFHRNTRDALSRAAPPLTDSLTSRR